MITRIEIIERGGPSVKLRAFNGAKAESLQAAGAEWHTKMMPRHFKPDAVSKYGYQVRTKKYMLRKAREKHHQDPIKWSGETERMVRRAKITSTNKQGRVVMYGPKHLYAYRKTYKQPHKAAELTAITADEIGVLDRFMDTDITRRLVAITTEERRMIG